MHEIDVLLARVAASEDPTDLELDLANALEAIHYGADHVASAHDLLNDAEQADLMILSGRGPHVEDA